MTFDSQSVCVSGSVFGNFHCSWIIPNFSSLRSAAGRRAIVSEYFQLQSYSPRWQLNISFLDDNEDDDEGDDESDYDESLVKELYGACFLRFCSKNSEEMLVKINSVSLRNIDGKVIPVEEFDPSHSSADCCYNVMEDKEFRRYSILLKWNTIIENLIDDVLIFCTSVSYCSTCIKDSANTQYLAEMSPISKLVQNFESLSSNEEHYDANILVEENKIPVNSVILGARSKVFQAMFKSDMEERKSKCVHITDFEKDIMDALIQFIYTGNVEFMDINIATELLRASDKYDMNDLMSYCSNYLISNMNEANVIQVLIKADMYNAQTLKTKAMQYLSGCRGREIIKKHRLLLKKHPDILLDILEANGRDDS